MKNSLIVFASILFLYSCKDNKTETVESIETEDVVKIDDSAYVKNADYETGDVRRYGLNPETTRVGLVGDVLKLAEQGLPIIFPKGYYPIDLRLRGKKNINITFDDATIGGLVEILEQDSVQSSNIKLLGSVTILDKLFIRNSSNITFENVRVVSNIEKNVRSKKNRGVSIYVGTENISFNSLYIEDTGGLDDDYYQYTAAAFQVHGWNNNPKSLNIEDLVIKNSDRTAIYLTGSDHNIKTTTITNFGLGSLKKLGVLGDAKRGEEKLFTGVWLNKCNNCILDSVTINNPDNKGTYSLHLGIGAASSPTFINTLQLDENAKKMKVEDKQLTNILIKREL